MLSSHRCRSLCVATCFNHTVCASSGNCQKNNIWTAGKSKMLQIYDFYKKNGRDHRAAHVLIKYCSVMQSSVTVEVRYHRKYGLGFLWRFVSYSIKGVRDVNG